MVQSNSKSSLDSAKAPGWWSLETSIKFRNWSFFIAAFMIILAFGITWYKRAHCETVIVRMEDPRPSVQITTNDWQVYLR